MASNPAAAAPAGPSSTEPAACLRGCAGEALRRALAGVGDLEATMDAAWSSVTSTWPGGLGVSLADYARYLALRLPDDARVGPVLAELHAADLYLACACVAGRRDALRAFERRYDADLAALALRFEDRDRGADDLLQVVRDKLLWAPDGGRPRLGDYRGRGPLRRWLRVTAMRTFIDRTRRGARPRAAREQLALELSIIADAAEGPEAAAIKAEARASFKDAFQRALADLTAGERNMLRHHLLGGLDLDALAAAHGVHRATAARRMARIRERLLRATRRELRAVGALDGIALDRLVVLVQSQLEISFERLLASGPRSARVAP